jgi:hypothetical protein
MDCPKIAVLDQNQEVEKVGDAADWSQIRVTRDGTIGWVSSRYLSPTPVAATPEVTPAPAPPETVTPPPLPEKPVIPAPAKPAPTSPPAVEKAPKTPKPGEAPPPAIKKKPEEAPPPKPAKPAKPAEEGAPAPEKPVKPEKPAPEPPVLKPTPPTTRAGEALQDRLCRLWQATKAVSGEQIIRSV